MPILSSKELAKCRTIFDKIDTNNSGGIDAFELYDGMRKYSRHISLDEIYVILETFDTDHSGEIDFDEFTSVITKLNPKTDDDEEILSIFISLGGDEQCLTVKTEYVLQYLKDFDIEYESDKLNMLLDCKTYNGFISYDDFKDVFFT